MKTTQVKIHLLHCDLMTMNICVSFHDSISKGSSPYGVSVIAVQAKFNAIQSKLEYGKALCMLYIQENIQLNLPYYILY